MIVLGTHPRVLHRAQATSLEMRRREPLVSASFPPDNSAALIADAVLGIFGQTYGRARRRGVTAVTLFGRTYCWVRSSHSARPGTWRSALRGTARRPAEAGR